MIVQWDDILLLFHFLLFFHVRGYGLKPGYEMALQEEEGRIIPRFLYVLGQVKSVNVVLLSV